MSRTNLNSRKAAAPYYEDARTAMIRHLQMAGGLYDLAVDFAAKSDARGAREPWMSMHGISVLVLSGMKSCLMKIPRCCLSSVVLCGRAGSPRGR